MPASANSSNNIQAFLLHWCGGLWLPDDWTLGIKSREISFLAGQSGAVSGAQCLRALFLSQSFVSLHSGACKLLDHVDFSHGLKLFFPLPWSIIMDFFLMLIFSTTKLSSSTSLCVLYFWKGCELFKWNFSFYFLQMTWLKAATCNHPKVWRLDCLKISFTKLHNALFLL